MKPEELKERLRGVLAYPPTPFTASQELDVDGLTDQIRYLAASGVGAVVVCGGVGEFYSLEIDEYKTCIRTAVEASAGRVPILAGIGHSTRIACQLAKHAAAVGADGIMINPPYFVDPSEDGLVAHYEAIARASGLGMMIYSTRHLNYSLDTMRRLVRIDEVIALKDEYGDLRLFGQMVEGFGSRLAWINGMAETLALPYCAAGAQAMTSGLVNLAPGLSLALWQAASNGRREEVERLLSRSLRPLLDLRDKRRGNQVPILKEAMNMLGRPGGTVRSPLLPIGPRDREELHDVLSHAGLLGNSESSSTVKGRASNYREGMAGRAQ